MGNNPSLYKNFNKNQFKEGSVVVITGASSGMGREMAYRYAKRGCKVVIAARRQERLDQIKDECLKKYGNKDVLAVVTDVSVEEQAKDLIDQTISNFGRIDILILAAGVSAHSLFEDFKDMEPFRKVVETNLYGCVYPTRYALPHMKPVKG